MIRRWNPNLLHVHDGDVVIYVFKPKYNTGWEGRGVGWGGVGGRLAERLPSDHVWRNGKSGLLVTLYFLLDMCMCVW